MDLSFEPGSFCANRAQLWPMFTRHWAEVAKMELETPLDMDWERYETLEALGCYRTVLAYDKARFIRGYCLFTVVQHIQYKNQVTAFSDGFYLEPSFRSGWAYLRMFRATMEYLRALKVQKVYVTSKAHLDFGPVLRRLDFQLVEHGWAKLL